MSKVHGFFRDQQMEDPPGLGLLGRPSSAHSSLAPVFVVASYYSHLALDQSYSFLSSEHSSDHFSRHATFVVATAPIAGKFPAGPPHFAVFL